MINNNLILIILNTLINLIDVLLVLLPVLLSVAFMTIIERKQLAAHQRRVGPVKCLGKALLWGKLSNSGDALKLMIPSYIRKAISGQSNYLGMVTSHKMNESEMGYRGSKSEFINQNPHPNEKIDSVKEQRVDGSYFNNFQLLQLRYTLAGFERNYHIKIPSKQLNKKSFSTLNNRNVLNPWFITGFSDAEGCFYIGIQSDAKLKTK